MEQKEQNGVRDEIIGAKDDIDQGGILSGKETPAKKEPRASTRRKVTPTKKAATQDATLTKEELASQMRLLTNRARAAGLNPLRSLLQAYGVLGMGMLESLLISLENADAPKKKKKK